MTLYREIARAQLKLDEGWRNRPYRDSVGVLTVGVGRNLDAVGLRDNEIALMLENDIDVAEGVAKTLIPDFSNLSAQRQAVIVNMAFNLGQTRLSKFTGTLAAINEGRFADAADGMMNSLWARQVGARASRLALHMRDG